MTLCSRLQFRIYGDNFIIIHINFQQGAWCIQLEKRSEDTDNLYKHTSGERKTSDPRWKNLGTQNKDIHKSHLYNFSMCCHFCITHVVLRIRSQCLPEDGDSGLFLINRIILINRIKYWIVIGLHTCVDHLVQKDGVRRDKNIKGSELNFRYIPYSVLTNTGAINEILLRPRETWRQECKRNKHNKTK